MSPLTALKTAYTSLTGAKLRTSLTILGIVIGITSVIGLMSVGRGAKADITKRIEGIGTNLLFISPQQANQGVARGVGDAAALTLDDARALADPEVAPDVLAVTAQVNTFAQLIAGANNMRAQVLGVTPGFADIRNYVVQEGEFITAQNQQSQAMVAVIGATVAQTLFPDDDPLGQRIRINNRQFTVTGVLQAKGGAAFGSQDSTVVVPLSTALSRLQNARSVRGSPRVDVITIQAVSSDAMDAAKMQATAVLEQEHRITTGVSDFQITSQQDLLDATSQIANVFTIVLGAIAGISLLVGGIGIMNIMLVSVVERTREIGIRKALGAQRRDVLVQFLVEAMLLSLTGGILGVALGYAAARGLSKLQVSGQNLTTVVSPDIIILAVSVSIAIGLFFGIFPASRAARLDPIECLRHE
ncbi:MAG: FtsX-like permease family protein [Dehalococcoidia bacterium]|nr:FtsX-like permease family protein [Dehalococcoidia bacterium]